MKQNKKILSLIGTRPQYIKIKPIYDFFRKSGVEHYILDTSQHYSDSVSKNIIKDLNLNIDGYLSSNRASEIDFISSCILDISKKVDEVKPDSILVFGDTNSSFCASLIAYKKGIKLSHVESGVRSETKIPEEINRGFVDSVSDVHFCSAEKHMKNVSNPILTGDLEYELLHSYNLETSYGEYALLTLHRQENLIIERFLTILEFLKTIKREIVFPIHHRTKKFIEDNQIVLPENIKVYEPFEYSKMVKALSSCRYVLTDSGGVHKCSPFFGKKSLILRSNGLEWDETYLSGFSRRFIKNKSEVNWLEESKIKQDKRFYLPFDNLMPSEIILRKLLEKGEE